MAERVPVLIDIAAEEADDDGEPMHVRVPGTAEKRAEGTVLRYAEHLTEEDGDPAARTEVTLLVRPGYAVMQRRGAYGAMMVFEPGQSRDSCYRTPYGDLPMSVCARTVETVSAESGGSLRLDYDLTVQGGPASRRVFALTWRECGPC
ncbi:MAG: DUF1934 domain-containing protein [Clostridia bacterium]|nr:DUF1934 domain-containing protein [Clostridia bacterium]